MARVLKLSLVEKLILHWKSSSNFNIKVLLL